MTTQVTHGARMEKLFILADDGNIKPASREVWEAWHAASKRHLGNTIISYGDNSVHVSTVFLPKSQGTDHSGAPYIFESVVFGDVRDKTSRAISADKAFYVTAAEALAGHRAIVDGWLWFLEHTLRWPVAVTEESAGYHPFAQRTP